MADTSDDVILPGYATAPAAAAAPAHAPAAGEDKIVLPAYADQPAQDKTLADAKRTAMLHKMGFEASPDEALGGLKSTFNQLLFGLGDDARALVPGMVKGDTIPDRLRQVHAERRAYDAGEHPKQGLIDFGANLLGGGIASAGLGKAVGAVAPGLVDFAANAGGPLAWLTRQTATAGVGGLFGAAGEAGKADPGKVLDAAKDGFGVGAITAPLVGALTKPAAWLAQKGLGLAGNLATNLGMRNPEKVADSVFIKALQEAKTDPSKLAQALSQQSDNGRLNMVAADVMPDSLRGQTKRLLTTSGDTAQIGDSILGSRAADMPNKIMSSISQHVSPLTNTNMELASLSAQRAAQAAPHYDSALKVPTIDATGRGNQDVADMVQSNGFMQDLLRNTATPLKKMGTPMQAAWVDGPMPPATMNIAKQVEVPGQPGKYVTKNFTVPNPDANKPTMDLQQVPSMADLHQMKLKLDTVINKTRDPITGVMNQTASFGNAEYTYPQLKAAKDQLVGLMDKLSTGPDGTSSYATARKIFTDHSALMDAMKHGEEVMKNRPEVSKMALDSLGSEAERDAMRAGMAGQMTDIAGNATTAGPVLNKLLNSPFAKERLNVMLDPVSRDKFIGDLGSYAKMNETNRMAKGGNIASLPFLESANNEKNLLYAIAGAGLNHPMAAIAAAGRGLVSSSGNVTKKVATPLLNRHLMSPDDAVAFAKDYAAQQANPVRKAGKAVTGALKMMYDNIPNTAANYIGQARAPEAVGGLSTYLNTNDQK
jgi:hypothetical protein